MTNPIYRMIQVTVNGEDGKPAPDKINVQAEMYGEELLALHSSLSGEGYNVTHTPTGFSICWLPKRTQAVKMIKELLTKRDLIAALKPGEVSQEARDFVHTCYHSATH